MNQELINKYDSEFCGSLPIHLINIIQEYGALLVIDTASLKIIQASENTETLFGKPVQQLVSSSITEYVDQATIATLQQKMSNKIKDKIPLIWEINGTKLLAIVHLKEPYYIVEINLESGDETGNASFVEVYQDLKYAMSAIENTGNIREVCRVAAEELKKVSGFDKVMIYQFDKDWNGHVLAEAMNEGMESYLDFTFPASDIPKQARDLYLKNPYRFIPDISYKPVKLYPVINPATNAFIDLSDCNLRGVTSVHLEYLKNMGVTASMSTRILNDDKLWGLIACHHRQPKQMSYQMCSVFELLSGVISAKINNMESRLQHVYHTKLVDVYTKLVEETYKSGKFEDNLLKDEHNLLQLFNASGAVVIYNGKITTAGKVPDSAAIEDLVMWLHTKELRKTLVTDSLSQESYSAAGYKDIASGLMVIPINIQKDEYILLFRPETIQVIKWGGNPEERMTFEKDMKTYHPRFSFKLWQENVDGRSLPWNDDEIQLGENVRSFVYEYTTQNML